MSIYDIVNKIPRSSNVKDSFRLTNDFVVAKFYNENSTEIKLFYSEYRNKNDLKFLTTKYESFEISYLFWDPEFCDMTNLSESDFYSLFYDEKKSDIGNKLEFLYGFLLGMLKVYNCIYYSYTSKFEDYKSELNLDKNTLAYLLTRLDIEINYSKPMLNLIKTVINDDNIVVFLGNNKGNFRLSNFIEIVKDTNKMNEISKLIMLNFKEPYFQMLYHLELLKYCNIIPFKEIVTNYNNDDIYANILHIDLDIGMHENLFIQTIENFINKEGNVYMKLKTNNEKVKLRQKFIKDYYKSYSSYIL